MKGILLVLGLPVAGLIAFAPDLMGVWMGPSFGQASGLSLQILLVGLLANGVAYIPFAFLQAHGRPDLVAKIQLAELPLFALLVYWCISLFGVTGAALAWTLRAGLDAVALLVMSARTAGGVTRALLNCSAGTVGVMLRAFGYRCIGTVAGHIEYRLLITCALVVTSGWISWKSC